MCINVYYFFGFLIVSIETIAQTALKRLLEENDCCILLLFLCVLYTFI